MKIVAIGGGEIGTTDDKPYNLREIDEEIVRLTEKAHPVLLFVGFNERANYFFGQLKKNYMALGVQCTYLKYTELENEKTVESKFKRANILFFNGGNTIEFMKKIKKYHLDKYISGAVSRDVVCAGISAGAIIFHKFGSSDSRTYKNCDTKFTKVSGLGFVDAMFLPHYSNSARPLDMPRMAKKIKQVAICADNQTALVINGDEYKVIKSNSEAKIYKCFNKNGQFFTAELEQSGKVKNLYEK